jgi:2-polyprenyl-3-methyl-5-hydroxy-6-metoxy-1,4-benzoquinol methylase
MNPPSQSNAKNVAAELAYQASHASLVEVQPIPDHVVRRYRETRHWRVFRNEYIFHIIKQLAPTRICDFGCGTGETSTKLALMGHTVVGFDLSPENIELAQRRAALDNVADRATFIVSNAAESGLAPGSFDLVLVLAVLHHIDLASALSSLDYILEPEGYVVISEPVAFSPFLQWLRDRTPVEKDISPNERQLNRDDLRQIAEKFEVINVRYFHLFTRLMRLFQGNQRIRPVASYILYRLDAIFLKIPFINHFCGNAVLLCRKRKT